MKDFEHKAFTELPFLEKQVLALLESGDAAGKTAANEFLTKYTNDFARATMNAYWELGDKFWAMFARGF